MEQKTRQRDNQTGCQGQYYSDVDNESLQTKFDYSSVLLIYSYRKF